MPFTTQQVTIGSISRAEARLWEVEGMVGDRIRPLKWEVATDLVIVAIQCNRGEHPQIFQFAGRQKSGLFFNVEFSNFEMFQKFLKILCRTKQQQNVRKPGPVGLC